ncbi:hypothetical protein ACLMJK_003363 [Lecanora helva]
MAKRNSDSDGESPHKKRQKITSNLTRQHSSTPTQNTQDLQQLLSFEQHTRPQVRQRILSFRKYLETIAYGEESEQRSIHRIILLEYLQSQTSQNDSDKPTLLADVVKIWQFACQENDENLYSSVAGVLALLLKTISSLIEFRESGNQLCKSLLQDDHVELFDKGLNASKTKEHLISSCLRLLTEIVLFDGGHSAHALFRQRQVTLKNFDIFLSMRKSAFEGGSKSHRKSWVRLDALRYLYANLRLQSPGAKMNLLAPRKILRAIFEDLPGDPPAEILGLIDALKKDVAADGKLTHSEKSRIFTNWVLGRLATLYNYADIVSISPGAVSVRNSVHIFLLSLCTSFGRGVLDPQAQSLPNITHIELTDFVERACDFRSDQTSQRKDQGKNRNQKLASFLQNLRPHADILQTDLILSVFRKAPDTILDYFDNRKSFSFDPKPTATFIGYSSFLLAIMQLPLSASAVTMMAKYDAPPLVSTVSEHLMPLLLDRKVTTRCLNQSVALIKYLSSRILIAALEKLDKVLLVCKSKGAAASELKSSLWKQFTSDLVTTFYSRLPDIKHVVTQFRSCPEETTLLREALTHLLALYHRCAPQMALDAKLDISLALASTVQGDLQGGGFQHLELDNVVEVACYSPGMQWWHKSEKIGLSLFTLLLKQQSKIAQVNCQDRQLTTLLEPVIKESQLLHCKESMLSLDVLILSLQRSDKWIPSSTVFEFLDNCILRLAKKPVHYFDLRCHILAKAGFEKKRTDTPIDLLSVTILEQWPYLVKSTDACSLTNAANWLVRYLELSKFRISKICDFKPDVGALEILSQVRDQLRNDVEEETCRVMLDKSLREPPELGLSLESALPASIGKERIVVEELSSDGEDQPEFSADLVSPDSPQEQDDHSVLSRWTREDVPDAIIDGTIEDLFLCLSSRTADIRQQAVAAVITFMGKLEASGYSEWRQTYVVAGELIETARGIVPDSPLPYVAGILAARLITAIADPLHPMYEKINTFLHRGSQWDVKKLPSYWLDKILMSPPTGDEAHHQEAEWLLDVLVDGLRTSRVWTLLTWGFILIEANQVPGFSTVPGLPCF